MSHIQKNNNINISDSSKLKKLSSIYPQNEIASPNNNVINEKSILTVNNNDSSIHYSQNFDFFFETARDNIKFVGEYLEDIYGNLLQEEQREKANQKYGYMQKQPDINDQMRAILIDWLFDVHLSFFLRTETLYQAIWIIDSYLSLRKIMRSKLQLLGIASLLISCKSQEIYYPQLNKFIEITDNAYNKQELLLMEYDVLKILNFNLIVPTSNDFYNILAKLFSFEEKQYFLGKYIIDCSLIDYEMIKYSASVIAASSAYLVMKFFRIHNYKNLYSNFIVKEKNPQKIIKEVAQELCILIKNLSDSKLKAIKNKYSLQIFHNVSESFEQFLKQ